MQDVTALGSVTVVVLITLLASGFVIIKKDSISLKFILISIIGGGLLELLMKGIFSRPRPAAVTHLVYADTLSFPSGHSAISSVVYLSLVYIIFNLDIKRNIKLYFLYSAVILILLVGFSRIYLGVHFPTDVIGGWALGLSWISISLIITNHLKKN